ncbi:FtsK/SpoIIIE domain-containing protein [Streptomyces sp. NPDC101150]|uniref:FtsK/SpoIIIE domain-containing protein n=1 Tax=Streptomyces sp. NPDC101150 TaxID=3366114 RepID=UPI0038129FDD
MRLTITVVDPAEGNASDFVIDSDPEAPVGEIAEELQRTLRGDGDALPELYSGDTALHPEEPLATAAVREGSVLALGAPLSVPQYEPDGIAEVRVVSGPDAGTVHRLPPGDYEIGAAAACRIRLHAAGLPEVVALLKVDADGRSQVRAADTAPVRLDDAPVPQWTTWRVAGLLDLGSVLLELSEPTRPDAALVPSADGLGLDYNRPPRLRPKPVKNRFRIPAPPKEPNKRKIPLIPLLLAPLVMASVSVLLFNNYRYLLFGLLSPLIAILSQVNNKRQGKQSYEEQVREHEEKLARLEQDIDETVQAEQAARRLACPDPAAAMLIATGPRQRLWERRWRDDDFLLLRLGTADRPAAIDLEDASQDEHRRRVVRLTRDVPVTVPLREVGVLGVAGPGEETDPLVRWLLAQSAILQSPSDLRICVLSHSRAERRWSWVHWLPQCAPTGEDALRLLGTNSDSVGRRIAELAQLVGARTAADKNAPRGGAAGEPDVFVVLDGARRLRSLPGVVQILRDGPSVGVYVLCIDDEERLLPEECQAVAVVDGGELRVEQSQADPVEGVRMDAPSLEWCVGVSRALAPIRDVGESDDAAVLPTSAALLDVLGLEPPSGEAVAAGWAVGGRTTRAVLGMGVDGPFAIDLAKDGPHGLIAGTTGSGKSELLQTLVATLAVANRPDAMNFVLVDYKGGSAFAECEDLPHTVGMVTDLDAHLVERALTSLGAELKRREHQLAECGAKDIDDYTDKRERHPELPPLPRLVLVIDEFASMVRELPDFVSGLVNIAQRGRSLGIHLMLATQRPTGAVTGDIRANTNLRIALRTTDTNESRDIIDAPEAGQLSPRTPGRAYARLGHAALMPFQTGRIGGRRLEAASQDRPKPVLTELHWELLGNPVERQAVQERAAQAVTDLSVLVRSVREANDSLGLAPSRKPWLAPLPDRLPLETLARPAEPVAPSGRLAPVPYGRIDLPAEQSQDELVFDLETMGHLHLIGSPRSGRSQALRSLAASLAGTHSTADVHLYGIDCGNGALQALGHLPHCGAVVDRSQVERIVRLVARLGKEVARRQAQLAKHGVADITELRGVLPAGERPAHLVVLVDRFEAFDRDFAQYDQGSLMDKVQRLLLEGASVGVHLVLAGDRVLSSTRFSSTTEDKLVLRLNEKADYGMFGVPTRQVPASIAPGRALRPQDFAEVQFALLGADASGAAQVGALLELAREATERDAAVAAALRPFRVDTLPDELTFDEAWERRPEGGTASPMWAMVGVGGDELTALGPNLLDRPSFLVGGPPKSGRSTVLMTVARSLLAQGTGLVITTPKSSPLRQLAGADGVFAVLDDPEIALADFRAAMQSVATDTGVVLVDDAELLLHSEIDADLATLGRGGAGNGWGLVTAGNTEALFGGLGGWIVSVKRNRCGALLSPQSVTESDIVGARVPHGLVGQGVEPGKAHVHLGDGKFVTVRVPHTTA